MSCDTVTITLHRSVQLCDRHGRLRIGANGVSWPPAGKMDEKLKSENICKKAVFYVYVIFWEQSGQAGVEALCWPPIYSDILQNAPFRSQIFFASSQVARGHWPPNQNPADVPGDTLTFNTVSCPCNGLVRVVLPSTSHWLTLHYINA